MPHHQSDVGFGAFEPWPDVQVHFSHGVQGARLAGERGDAVCVIDVLSFSTTMSIALEKGATVLSLSSQEIDARGGRDAVAAEFDADVVAKRRDDYGAKFTLSPASLSKVVADDRLILTSLNGARLVAAGSTSPFLVAGSLRCSDASAATLARALEVGLVSRLTLVAAGEHWSSVAPGEEGVRPALEDDLGAGAIASALARKGLTLSAEASVVADTFERERVNLTKIISESVSGRELIERGFADDVSFACELNAASAAPVQRTDRFFSYKGD